MKRTTISPQEAIRILELPSRFTLTELRAAHREQIQVWHPDRFAHNTHLCQKADERTKAINEAYEHLKTLPLTGVNICLPVPTPADCDSPPEPPKSRTTSTRNHHLQAELEALKRKFERHLNLIHKDHKFFRDNLQREHQAQLKTLLQSIEAISQQLATTVLERDAAQERVRVLENRDGIVQNPSKRTKQ